MITSYVWSQPKINRNWKNKQTWVTMRVRNDMNYEFIRITPINEIYLLYKLGNKENRNNERSQHRSLFWQRCSFTPQVNLQEALDKDMIPYWSGFIKKNNQFVIFRKTFLSNKWSTRSANIVAFLFKKRKIWRNQII